jgi:carbamoyl-phosphate synthase large subunit
VIVAARPSALVLGGSRWQVDVIRRAAELGLRTIVADISASAPGRACANTFVEIDTNDREGLLKLARAERVDAVIAEQTDRVVPVAAYLNEQLRLPGIDPATARVFTDKYAMRNALAAARAGVMMPRYAEVRSAGEALEHARAWGYPVVLKPKTSQASLGVFKVDDADELRRFFGQTVRHAGTGGAVLVEEFIDGTEVTVEAFSLDGRCHVLAVSEKAHYAFNPCVARRLAYPPRFEPPVLDRVRSVAARVVETLGLRDGISHAEYRVRDGVPYLIEVAARGGGNRIASLIVPHVSGVDMYELLISRLLERPVSMPPIEKRAAILEFFDFAPGVVRSIRGVEEVGRAGLVADMAVDVAHGSVIHEPTDDRTRLGYFIAVGETRDDVDGKATRVKDLVHVEYA